MDLLRRVLEYNGYKLKHVMNITDVGHLVSDADEGEDKMRPFAGQPLSAHPSSHSVLCNVASSTHDGNSHPCTKNVRCLPQESAAVCLGWHSF